MEIMKRKKIFRIAIIVFAAGIITVTGVVLYMFNMPHRDVLKADADYSLNSSALVKEYLENATAANDKYLSEDGDSKILQVTGIVASISEDYSSQKVVLLKDSSDQAGVSATFTQETGSSLDGVTAGQEITVKGVIRSGASYDKDLGFYENVLLEKSVLIK